MHCAKNCREICSNLEKFGKFPDYYSYVCNGEHKIAIGDKNFEFVELAKDVYEVFNKIKKRDLESYETDDNENVILQFKFSNSDLNN